MSANFIDSCGHIWKLDKKFVKKVKQNGKLLLKNNFPEIYIYSIDMSIFAVDDNYYTLLDNYIPGKFCLICEMIKKIKK